MKSREETYKEFCKYALIVQFGNTFEERKQAWIMCNEVAKEGNIDIIELMQWRSDEARENEYEDIDDLE